MEKRRHTGTTLFLCSLPKSSQNINHFLLVPLFSSQLQHLSVHFTLMPSSPGQVSGPRVDPWQEVSQSDSMGAWHWDSETSGPCIGPWAEGGAWHWAGIFLPWQVQGREGQSLCPTCSPFSVGNCREECSCSLRENSCLGIRTSLETKKNC